eukprot:scaffold16076_cov103-Isochrysis_galbana.AAC.2
MVIVRGGRPRRQGTRHGGEREEGRGRGPECRAGCDECRRQAAIPRGGCRERARAGGNEGGGAGKIPFGADARCQPPKTAPNRDLRQEDERGGLKYSSSYRRPGAPP